MGISENDTNRREQGIRGEKQQENVAVMAAMLFAATQQCDCKACKLLAKAAVAFTNTMVEAVLSDDKG